MVAYRLKGYRGLTLIELLVALAISAILTAALYRTFIGQHRTYTAQEQVVDMQQNARVAINHMMREIRMAGFGNVLNVFPPGHLPFVTLGGFFQDIINPGDNVNNVGQHDDQITIIAAFEQVSTLRDPANRGDTIVLEGGANQFNLFTKRYICIGGLETHIVRWISGNTITLESDLLFNHAVGTPVYKVKAINYRLRWDHRNPNMPVLTRGDLTDGGGSQVVAENIDNLQFSYILDDGSQTDSPVDPSKIRMVKVTVTARTSMSDPEFKGGEGGFRRRTISSNILVRNMGVNP